MLDKLKALFKLKAPDALKTSAPSATQLAPVVVIACGAGMAFWWWSQWARSREEARASEAEPHTGAPVDSMKAEVTDILDADALDGLDESLAVQADADHVNASAASAAA